VSIELMEIIEVGNSYGMFSRSEFLFDYRQYIMKSGIALLQ